MNTRSVVCPECAEDVPAGASVCPHCDSPLAAHLLSMPAAPVTRPRDADGFGAGTVVAHRYQLESLLGEGAFGEVWRAQDLRLTGKTVALKFLKQEHLVRPDIVARFESEASALAVLQHPNVVAVLDRGEWGARRYLVTEFVAGQSLSDWLERHRRSGLVPNIDIVRSLFDQICAGVEAAHSVHVPGPIVHRDIKPENVLIRELSEDELAAKVLDFGIAQLGGRSGTHTGMMLGTPLYMAPEQALGRSGGISPATDVFALGVLLVEMLTLRATPRGDDPWWGVVLRDPSAANLIPTELRSDVPEGVWGVAAQCLAAEPSARFSSAGAVRVAFRRTGAVSSVQSLAGGGARLSAAPPSAPPSAPSHSPTSYLTSPLPPPSMPTARTVFGVPDIARPSLTVVAPQAPETGGFERNPYVLGQQGPSASFDSPRTSVASSPRAGSPPGAAAIGVALIAGLGIVGFTIFKMNDSAPSSVADAGSVAMMAPPPPSEPVRALPPSIPPPPPPRAEAPLPVVAAPVVGLVERPTRVGSGPLAPTSVSASSFIRGEHDRHGPAAAFDGDPATAWNENDRGPGDGSWIAAGFDAPVEIETLRIATGWDATSARHGDLFPLNSHFRRVRISFDGNRAMEREVGVGQRYIDVTGLHERTRSVRITALSVWPGTEWADLCVSEISIEGHAIEAR